jgi:hypothetical protein
MVMKISVRTYIDTAIDRGLLLPTNHREVLRDAGYYEVEIDNTGPRWREIHNWCEANLGWENYNWTGSTFWFNTDEDRVFFMLRWS